MTILWQLYDKSAVRMIPQLFWWILTTEVPYERPSLKYTPKLSWNPGFFNFYDPRARQCTLRLCLSEITDLRYVANTYKWVGKSFMDTKDTMNYQDYNIFSLSVVYFPFFPSLPIYSESLSDRTESGFEIRRRLNNSTSNTSSIVCLCKIKSLQFVHISWMNVSTYHLLNSLCLLYHINWLWDTNAITDTHIIMVNLQWIMCHFLH